MQGTDGISQPAALRRKHAVKPEHERRGQQAAAKASGLSFFGPSSFFLQKSQGFLCSFYPRYIHLLVRGRRITQRQTNASPPHTSSQTGGSNLSAVQTRPRVRRKVGGPASQCFQSGYRHAAPLGVQVPATIRSDIFWGNSAEHSPGPRTVRGCSAGAFGGG